MPSASQGQDTELVIEDCEYYPYFTIPKAFFIKHRPSWRAQVVYNTLKFHAHTDQGDCKRVGLKTLADRVNISEQTMRRGLKELVAIRALKIIPQQETHKNGEKLALPNVYRLLRLS